MLALAKQAGFGAGQDQGKGSDQIRAPKRADRRLDEIGQRRMTVIEEGLGPELDFPRWGGKTAWVSLVVARGMLDVPRRQRFAQSGRFRAKLIQGNTARTELMAVSGIDIAIP